MANWDLTLGLQNLRAQINAAFPERDKASDGTIGDAAHQAGTSSHNPDDSPGNKGKPEWNGDLDANAEVRAWDMDSDLRAAPATAQQVVDHLRKLPKIGTVLRYMIYNGRLYHVDNDFGPETYAGPSPHTEHIHFTGAFTQAADNNTSFDYRLEEIPVALTAADRTWITSTIAAEAKKAVEAGALTLRRDQDPGWSDTAAHNLAVDAARMVNGKTPAEYWGNRSAENAPVKK